MATFRLQFDIILHRLFSDGPAVQLQAEGLLRGWIWYVRAPGTVIGLLAVIGSNSLPGSRR